MPGLLGDTPARDYSRKLQLFNTFAACELRAALASLQLQPGMRVLDAGCGTGEALSWLAQIVGPQGEITGLDLATAHVATARTHAPQARVIRADLLETVLPEGYFDAIWCVNTINHLRDPVAGIRTLSRLLRPRGVLALGQSAFVPDMLFAWDARLERQVNEAVRQYYRDRYQVTEEDLTAVRATAGLLRQAGMAEINAMTTMIERLYPVDSATEDYLLNAVFRDTWGERLARYLSQADQAQLARLCDPQHAEFALRRPDFHYLQSFTLTSGRRSA